MQNYYHHLILLLKRLFLIMVLMTLLRIVFYVFNKNAFVDLSAWQLVQHLIYGLRFDLSIVFITNLLFIFISIFPDVFYKWKLYHKFLKFLFIIVNSCLIVFNLIDTKFFEFEGKRLAGDIFSKEWLGKDFFTLLPEFSRDYWYLLVFFIMFVYVFVKLYPEYKAKKSLRKTSVLHKYVKQSVIGLLVLVFSVYAARGGTQLKPIDVVTAAKYTSPENMSLVLNSPFTIIKTLKSKSLPEVRYYSESKLDKIYSPIKKFEHSGKFKKKNVVIIILESFGREYSGFLNDTIGYTPNLDSIMKVGLTFTNAYANGKRSIEALPAIFSSLPALMDRALINTQYISNSIEGFGSILKKLGYESSFYHGGKNGTMGFDDYIKLSGIENYFGKDEYPNENDYDGSWGIYDEPYLQYFVDELSTMNEPFFGSVFTLSSHHPYKIPEKHKNRFPKGELENHESVGYTDYAIGLFFNKAKSKHWFKNTLFVITSDHTAQAKAKNYKTNIGKYAVPIVFYAPDDASISGVSDVVCQHIDILPSVLDYIGYNEHFIAFGNSVFNEDANKFAVNYISGVHQLITNNVAISFDGEKILSTKYFDKNTLYSEPKDITDSIASEEAKTFLKAIIQQYNQRMNDNNLIFNSEINE